MIIRYLKTSRHCLRVVKMTGSSLDASRVPGLGWTKFPRGHRTPVSLTGGPTDSRRVSPRLSLQRGSPVSDSP